MNAMQNQNDPKSVQQLMGESTLENIVKKAQILDKINHCLPVLLDEQLATYCHVLNLKNNHLLLACNNSAIATQIRYQEQDLLINLKRLMPELVQIDRVTCLVRPN